LKLGGRKSATLDKFRSAEIEKNSRKGAKSLKNQSIKSAQSALIRG
jgi:hypothetical protein